MIADRTPLRLRPYDSDGPFFAQTSEHAEYIRALQESLGIGERRGPLLPPFASRRPRPRRVRLSATAIVALIWFDVAGLALVLVAAFVLIGRLLLAGAGRFLW